MAGSINTPTPPVGVGQPLWLLAELTYRCPLHCVFCYNPVQLKQASSELTTAEWVEVMRQARQLGAAQLGFSGGEPLVRDDLEELVQEAHRLGYYTNLITSGVGLTPARAQRLKDAGLDHVQLSFQDSTRELNDFLSHTKTFELKKKVAQTIKAHDWPMVMNCVLHRHNLPHVGQIIEMALDLGAEYLELANVQYYGWAWVNRDHLMPTRAQLQEALAALPYPVTLAIWPRAPHARATADVAAQRRLDVMAHVPMEPLARADGKRPQPGPGALRTDMDPGQIRAALADNLSALPSAMGLNNHMGSAFTGSAASCRRLCAWLEGMGFFVLDSLTTPDSQLGVQTRALGMVSAVRDVFLDTRRQTPDILSALDQAAAKARARGYAVAIGHPYEETLRALRTWQDKEQVALVPLRRLVWRLAQEKAAGTAHIPAR